MPTKSEGNETSVDNSTMKTTTLSPEEQAKQDEMLKLQQKITEELLNSNLKEKERNELQVIIIIICPPSVRLRRRRRYEFNFYEGK